MKITSARQVYQELVSVPTESKHAVPHIDGASGLVAIVSAGQISRVRKIDPSAGELMAPEH